MSAITTVLNLTFESTNHDGGKRKCEDFFAIPGNYDRYMQQGGEGMVKMFRDMGWNVQNIPLPEPPKQTTPMPVIPAAYANFGATVALTAVPSTECVEQREASTQDTSPYRFQEFVLFDPNIDAHLNDDRYEFDGWHFVRYVVLDRLKDKEIMAYYNDHGYYSIGIVRRGDTINDAYFPKRNTVNHEERMWVAQAESLKAWAEYHDAYHAEWLDLQEPQGALKPVSEFNPEWLPGSIKGWVENVSKRMSVPIDFAAICAICTLAGATGHRAFVYPKANDKEWCEPICISGAVVALSGKKKSSTWKAFINPLYANEKDFERESEYAKKYAEYKKALKLFRQDDPLRFALSEPEKPLRLVLNDSTPEKMHDICKDNPQGLLYYRDELSGWAAEMDMVGRESMRSFFLAGMTGDQQHTVDRIGREGGSATLTFTVFGSFQPHLMVNFLSDAVNIANGTIPRFHLLVWPDNVKLPRNDSQADSYAKEQYQQIVRSLVHLKDKSVFLHFDKEAQQLFYNFEEWLENKIDKERNPGKASHLAKYAGGLPKIAALFQLVDAVSNQPQTSSSTVNLDTGKSEIITGLDTLRGNVYIDAAHFQKAWDFLRYLETHMHRVYDSKLEGVEYRKARLLERIRKGELKDGLTAREIYLKEWSGLGRYDTSADSICAALEELAELGWVRAIPTKPGAMGRPTKRWEVNPAVKQLRLEEQPDEDTL